MTDQNQNKPSTEDDIADDVVHRVVEEFAAFQAMDFDDDSILTDEDRQMLDARSRKIAPLARLKGASEPVKQVDSTMQESAVGTNALVETQVPAEDTQHEGEPTPSKAPQGYGKLIQNLNAVHTSGELNWDCVYRKTEIIGRGGQGTVFKMHGANEHQLIKALKVFSPEPYGDAESYQAEMTRLADVARLVYNANGDIIEQFDFQNGLFMMLMRWIDGDNLASLLEPDLLDRVQACVDPGRRASLNDVVVSEGPVHARLKPGVAVYIITKCLRALLALHTYGIIHGDIKPSNIMLDRFGRIRLVDYGSAFQRSMPPKKHTWTPMYAPPEVFKGGKWTPQSDLASLGYVLIELLSGQPAVTMPRIGSASTRDVSTEWDQQLLEEKRELPDRLEDLFPNESPALKDFLKRLIDPDPLKRFPTADEALLGRYGTYPFLQSLIKMDLAAPFSNEIRIWLTDIRAADEVKSTV